MATTRPRCFEHDCFANKCGYMCEILTAHSKTTPCPFFKTISEYENGQVEAHNKLVKKKRQDLINKYEFNEFRRGQW